MKAARTPRRISVYAALTMWACAGLASAAELAVPYRFGDVQKWAPIFEATARDRWQLPDKVLELLELRAGQDVADIGAGSGYFTRRLARQVGAEGHVYAVDIEPAMLEYLARRAKTEGVGNISVVLGDANDSRLPPACCDLLFLCNTYHMIADRPAYLRHLATRLRPRGRIAIIDWRKRPLPRGPKPRWKLTEDQVRTEVAAAGLQIQAQHQALPYQYFFIISSSDNQAGRAPSNP